eukprot:1188534-Prorocentrum_minimum.AAC.3
MNPRCARKTTCGKRSGPVSGPRVQTATGALTFNLSPPWGRLPSSVFYGLGLSYLHHKRLTRSRGCASSHTWSLADDGGGKEQDAEQVEAERGGGGAGAVELGDYDGPEGSGDSNHREHFGRHEGPSKQGE